MCLDLFGIHIFSVGEHDHFLAPSGNEEIAAGIEVAEVAGVEPALAQGFGRGLGPIPISLHHDRAADGNLTCWRRAILHRFRVHDLGFDARKRPPDRTKYYVPRKVDKGAARGFRQAVRVQNVDAKRVKVAGDGGVESRTSGHQITHAMRLPKVA